MMKRTLTSMTILILGATLFILAFHPAARTQMKSMPEAIKESNAPENFACGAGKTFTFGAGLDLFKFCLSDHGNILQLQSPANFRHITTKEGYVVCGGGTNAYDAGIAEGGWEAATAISQPGGANTLPVTITRASVDGKFQLKQTFDWNPAQKEITVTMVLKNISGASIANVRMARYFDGDLSSNLSSIDPTDDIYNGSDDSVLGKDNGVGAGHYGIMLTNLGFAQLHAPAVEKFDDFVTTRSTCTPTEADVPTAPGDYTGRMTFPLGTIAAGTTKTVKVLYRRF